MTFALLITAVLFTGTLAGHCFVARVLAERLTGRNNAEFLVLCWTLGVIHITQVGLYAGGFAIGEWLGAGSFDQSVPMSAMDIFYFSLVNFTTLGLGQVFPTGHLRFIAGFEAFNGFLCISLSASLVFRWVHGNVGNQPGR